MGVYSTKMTNYGNKEKISFYHSPISYGEDHSPISTDRQRYSDMSDFKRKQSDERRIRYYKKKVAELTEIALMNTDLNTAITLTFKSSITSYDYALQEWQLFLKRLRHSCKDPLKYISVWEYQKQRSQKEGITDGGIFHFHFITNTGFIEQHKLEKLWRNGFVWIEHLNNAKRRERAIRYTMKYITKEVIEHAADRGKRYIFTSNNLLKPSVTYLEDKLCKEDVIFEHLEELIKDGEYEMKNANGQIINHVEYVEYKK